MHGGSGERDRTRYLHKRDGLLPASPLHEVFEYGENLPHNFDVILVGLHTQGLVGFFAEHINLSSATGNRTVRSDWPMSRYHACCRSTQVILAIQNK
jgi:hypothetical protein